MGHEVLRHRDEVVVGLLALLLQGSLVPVRPKLATTADVSHHIAAASLQPGRSRHCLVRRRQGDLKAPIPVEKGWGCPVQCEIGWADHKVWDLGAIRRDGLVLGGGQPFAVKLWRQRLEGLHRRIGPGSGVAQGQRGGLQEVGNGDPQLVRLLAIDGAHGNPADFGRRLGPRVLPPAAFITPVPQAALDAIQRDEDKEVAGGGVVLQGAALCGAKEHCEGSGGRAAPLHHLRHARRQKGAAGVASPCGPQADEHLVREGIGGGVVRQLV
mmetsp:Transcript_28478/g.80360  ORF Transcript_28478/g.80360 Transcript_28478/m.80360 type:complete len:269 (-) Transcript_28478:1109-1915(-)